MRKPASIFLLFFLAMVNVHGADLSVFAGWTDVNSVTTTSGEISFDNFNVYGLRFETDFFVILGFENNFGFSTNSLSSSEEENEKGIYYTANLVLNLPVGRTLPYVTWGLGVLTRFGESRFDIGASFLTNWGGGLKLRRIAGPLGVRADYRRFTIHNVLDESVRTNELSGGIMLTF